MGRHHLQAGHLCSTFRMGHNLTLHLQSHRHQALHRNSSFRARKSLQSLSSLEEQARAHQHKTWVVNKRLVPGSTQSHQTRTRYLPNQQTRLPRSHRPRVRLRRHCRRLAIKVFMPLITHHQLKSRVPRSMRRQRRSRRFRVRLRHRRLAPETSTLKSTRHRARARVPRQPRRPLPLGLRTRV